MTSLTCLCLKYGTLYGAEYVNRLFDALKRNNAGISILWCMTDDLKGIDQGVKISPLLAEPFADRMDAALLKAPKQGRMKNLGLFKSGLQPNHSGPILVLDLDVAICADIAPFFTYALAKVCMRSEGRGSGKAPSVGHGSIERFDPELHPYLSDFMAESPEEAVAFGYGSEKSYTSRNAVRAGDFEPFPSEWIARFKFDCRPPAPFNLRRAPRPPARAVRFHGRPKMAQAVDGYRAGAFHSTRPSGWLRDAWIGETL